VAPERLRTPDVHAAAERAARTSYGRLVALLAARSGDVVLSGDTAATRFQPWWATRGHLLARCGGLEEAAAALEEAAALARDPVHAEHLRRPRAALGSDPGGGGSR
jgi:hypothetical protein